MNLFKFNSKKIVETKETFTSEELLVTATMGISGQAGSISNKVNKHLYEGDNLNVEELTKDLEGLSRYYNLLKDIVKGKSVDVSNLETNRSILNFESNSNSKMEEKCDLSDILKEIFNNNCAYKMREYLEDTGWELSDRCLNNESYKHVEYMKAGANSKKIEYINVIYGSCEDAYSHFRQQVYKLSCVEGRTMEEMCCKILKYIKKANVR